MKITSLKRDSKAIEEGRWVSDIPEMAGLSLKVRGSNNIDARRLTDTLMASQPREARIKGLDPLVQDEIQAKVALDTILQDWKGLENEDGTPLLYSKEVAKQLLTDPDFAKFQNAVVWASGRVGEAVTSEVADDSKN